MPSKINTLHLTVKKKWFNDIELGKKDKEYRIVKPYWEKRLIGKDYDYIEFRNGYRKDSRKMTVKFLELSMLSSGIETDLKCSDPVFVLSFDKNGVENVR